MARPRVNPGAGRGALSSFSLVVAFAAVALVLTTVVGVVAADADGDRFFEDGGGRIDMSTKRRDKLTEDQRAIDERRQQHIDRLFAKAEERKRRERGEMRSEERANGDARDRDGDAPTDKRRHSRLPRKMFPHVDGAEKDDEKLDEQEKRTKERQQERRARPDEADASESGGGGKGGMQLEAGEDRREESERAVLEHAGPDVRAFLEPGFHHQRAQSDRHPVESRGEEGGEEGGGEGGGGSGGSKCLNGYASATKLGTCVCSHGWGGDNCEIDKIPSCNRDQTYTCTNVVTGRVLAHPSCACYSECRTLLKEVYGEEDFKWGQKGEEEREGAFFLSTAVACVARPFFILFLRLAFFTRAHICQHKNIVG